MNNKQLEELKRKIKAMREALPPRKTWIEEMADLSDVK